MEFPAGLRYTKEHAWVRLAGGEATVGITDHAQKELGDVVFVELPEPGELFDAGSEFGTIESVKAVSELFLPVAGEVVEVNAALKDEPNAVNEDPHGDGWLVRVKVTSDGALDGLMNAAAYEKFVEEEAKA